MALGRSVGGIHVLDRARRDGVVEPQPQLRVIYIHGAMDRSAAFLRVMRTMPDVEHLALDRRGYGRSTPLGPAVRFQQHVEDLFAVMDGEPAVVVGHSAGGAVALAAAQANPELVRAVVTFESPRSWADWWPRADPPVSALSPIDTVERFMRAVAGRDVWEALSPPAKKARYLSGPALQADLTQLEAEPLYDASQIAVPVVVGYGTPRDWRHVIAAEELLAQLPNCELRVINDTDHGAHMTHPRPFAELVRRALELAEQHHTTRSPSPS